MSRGPRFVLVGVDAFLALFAIVGAIRVVPYLPPEWLAGSPFPDYAVPALGLGATGAVSAVAGVAVLTGARLGAWLSGASGVMIVVFEAVEIATVGLTMAEYGPAIPQSWLQLIFIAVGLVQGVLAVWQLRGPGRTRRSSLRTG